ncbi:MAG TPA: phenylalanine--tRNA ligase subunit alpha, partial [Halobacteriales archaeon]|nr:phenylalanine--tRNA ligase subunit alpha [Halobacteriales archaeon]
MKLPEAQAAVLEAASATDPKTTDELADETGLDPNTVAGAAFGLEEAGLVEIDESVEETVEATDEGATYADSGLPEVRLYRAAVDLGADESPVPMGEAIGESGLEGAEVDIALSNYARKGYGAIESGEITAEPDADSDGDAEARVLAAIEAGEAAEDADGGALDQLERRGLVEVQERTVRSLTLSPDGVTALMEGVEVAESVDRLTPSMLAGGEWRDVELSEYNVEADAAPLAGGRVHPLRQMAERVKDVLVGMGFQEM